MDIAQITGCCLCDSIAARRQKSHGGSVMWALALQPMKRSNPERLRISADWEGRPDKQ